VLVVLPITVLLIVAAYGTSVAKTSPNPAPEPPTTTEINTASTTTTSTPADHHHDDPGPLLAPPPRPARPR
jgi:hypothetical protein